MTMNFSTMSLVIDPLKLSLRTRCGVVVGKPRQSFLNNLQSPHVARPYTEN